MRSRELLAFDMKHMGEILRWILEDRVRLEEFMVMKGETAQRWLDRMQQVVDYPDTAPEIRSSIFKVMLRLSKNSGRHPICLSIQNVKRIGCFPLFSGGFGDVWKGSIGVSRELVCLKIVRTYVNSDIRKLSDEYLREAILWRQLKHPHLLPFLGLYRLEDTQQLCLISPWMEQGNLMQFLKNTRREDVDHYTLASDVAAGLAYLHLNKIVHGDLKGLNILITDALRACIGDFGLSRIVDTHGLEMTVSSTRPVGTARWLAPELLLPVNGARPTPSKKSDMYAYSCVCYEIFTGLFPFSEISHEMSVALRVVQGQHPARPQVPELTDEMWAFMESCWNSIPAVRPSASRALHHLARMGGRKSFFPASDWADSLYVSVWNNVQYRPKEDFNLRYSYPCSSPWNSPSLANLYPPFPIRDLFIDEVMV